MVEIPELRQSGVLLGTITPQEFRAGQLSGTIVPMIEGAEVANRDLGTFKFQFTVLAYWHGEGGPWEFIIRTQEEHLFGKPSPEVGLTWNQQHKFPVGSPDFVMLAAMSCPVTTYGKVLVTLSCAGQIVETKELRIVPPQSEIDSRR